MSAAPGPVPTISDAMVKTRDGVGLATDVYLPAGKGPFPVLLERTPYGKRRSNRGDRTAVDPVVRSKPEIASQFVASGYAYVLQDCRGRYGSEGEFTKYLSEGEDGEDTLAWILAQDWCDGRVGTLGLSYGAHVQAALACGNPAGLGAMFLDSGGFSSAYHGGIRQGGAYELKQLTWGYKHALIACESRQDKAGHSSLSAQDLRDWMSVRWRSGASPLTSVPEYEDYIIEQWDNDRFQPFWKQRGIYAAGWYDVFSDVPQVHMSSWFDPYAQTAIDNFTALSRLKTGPIKLVLGPWTHGQRSVTYAGMVDFGSGATLDSNLAEDYVDLRRRWFDRHLRHLPVPDPLPDPVTVFQMGGGSGQRNSDGRLDHGGHWIRAKSWPLPGTLVLEHFFHPDGTIREDQPQSTGGTCSFRSDPAEPVPTIGGAITSGEPIMFAGGFDQRENEGVFAATQPDRALSDRDDVIAFRSAPLIQDTVVAGNIRLTLFVSCDTPDADITVKLIDEYPPSADYPEGFALNLAHGIRRLRFRDSFEIPEPMVSGTIYEVSIETFPTCNLFKAGHRLRVDLSGSNFPHFDINPNTDWRDRAAIPQVANITVHCSPEQPSSVHIPILPSG